MRAPCPTTRPTHPLSHFIEPHFDTPLSCFFFLCRYYPANPLIARKWCYILPKSMRPRIRINCPFQIFRYSMWHSAREFFRSGHYTPNNIRVCLVMNYAFVVFSDLMILMSVPECEKGSKQNVSAWSP